MHDETPAERAARLRTEASNLDRRAEEKREDSPTYADHLERRADWCRRLARDEER